MMANTAVTTHPARNGQGSAPLHTLEGDMEWNRFPPEFKLGAEEQAKVDAYLALIEERSREAASTAAERDEARRAEAVQQQMKWDAISERDALKLRVAALEADLRMVAEQGRQGSERAAEVCDSLRMRAEKAEAHVAVLAAECQVSRGTFRIDTHHFVIFGDHKTLAAARAATDAAHALDEGRTK